MMNATKTQIAKILLIEDEPDMVHLVSNWLRRQEHTVDVINNGDEAIAYLTVNKHKHEVIILDIMLPGRGGIEVCQAYRDQSGDTPILMLTARDSIDDKDIAFRIGADDYLTKPFHLKELSARINALLRRSRVTTSERFVIDDVCIYLSEHRVTKAEQPVHLAPKEFQLLEFLVRHPKQVFCSEDLLQNVWGIDSDAMHDTVRGHINRLRRKLDTPGKPSFIASIYGFGYRFDPPECLVSAAS
jgi:DNA-binding response OmpR family regulator